MRACSSHRPLFSRREALKLGGAALLLAACRRAAPSTSTLALVNGTLIDGTGAGPLADGLVLIEGPRIAAVGAGAQIAVPAQAQVIDVQGATILPGLINAHVHEAYDEETLRGWAQGGVTTVRDLGNGGDVARLFARRDKLRAEPACARLVAAGPMITVPDGYPIVPWGGSGLTVTSPEDARQKVEGLIDQGADVVKIALESGRLFERAFPILSPDEAAAIVDAAHAQGMLVSAHVTVSPDLETALDLGVDDVAHMVVDRPSDALIGRAVQAGVYWTPTLELWHGVSRANAVDFDRMAVANTRRFVEAGGRVALGTDYAGYNAPFELGTPMREITMMQEAGMAPLQIIQAATQNAAHVCGLEDEIGTLEAGKAADILVVEGDPLQDVEALARVMWVVRDGVVIRGDRTG